MFSRPNGPRARTITSGKHQRGAVAIEFAALFGLFLVMVYAILAYSLPMLLTLSFKQLSADAARAAVQVDPKQAAGAYANTVAVQVADTITSSWLPPNWRQGNCPAPEADGHTWQALPATGGTSYGHLAIDNSEPYDPRYLLRVCIQRKYNPTGNSDETAIIPTLNLLGFDIPMLPKDTNGDVTLRGYTSIRL